MISIFNRSNFLLSTRKDAYRIVLYIGHLSFSTLRQKIINSSTDVCGFCIVNKSLHFEVFLEVDFLVVGCIELTPEVTEEAAKLLAFPTVVSLGAERTIVFLERPGFLWKVFKNSVILGTNLRRYSK